MVVSIDNMVENLQQSDYGHCVELFTWPAGCAPAPITAKIEGGTEENKRTDNIHSSNYPVPYTNEFPIVQGGASWSAQSAHILLLEGNNPEFTPKLVGRLTGTGNNTTTIVGEDAYAVGVGEQPNEQPVVSTVLHQRTNGASISVVPTSSQSGAPTSLPRGTANSALRDLVHQRGTSTLGKGNIEKLDSCDPLYTPIPLWLKRLQRKLPWYKAHLGETLWVSLRIWDTPHQRFWKGLS